MKRQIACMLVLGSGLTGPALAADPLPAATPAQTLASGPVPIIRGVSESPGDIPVQKPVLVDTTQTSSRKSEQPQTNKGVIRLIEPPRVAGQPEAVTSAPESSRQATEKSSPKSTQSEASLPLDGPTPRLSEPAKSKPADGPSATSSSTRGERTAAAPLSRPETNSTARSRSVRKIQTPLVVHRTPRLALSIDLKSVDNANQQQVQVTVLNESPQSAGRSQLIVSLPEGVELVSNDSGLQIVSTRDEEVLRLVANLDGMPGSDERVFEFIVDSTYTTRGLVHALIETEAEASQILVGQGETPPTATAQLGPRRLAPLEPTDELERLPSDEDWYQTLKLEGPTRGQKGATLVYRLVLENTSTEDWEQVVIEPQLGSGLYLEGRRQIRLNDPLLRGERGEVEIAIRAHDAGLQSLKFVARNAGNVVGQVSAELEVVASDLQVGMAGPEKLKVGEETTFVIDLVCEGAEPLKDVVVTLAVPDNFQVTKLEYEAGVDKERRLMAWRIVELEPGARVQLHYKAIPTREGEAKQSILVKTPNLARSLSTSLTSEVKQPRAAFLGGGLLKR